MSGEPDKKLNIMFPDAIITSPLGFPTQASKERSTPNVLFPEALINAPQRFPNQTRERYMPGLLFPDAIISTPLDQAPKECNLYNQFSGPVLLDLDSGKTEIKSEGCDKGIRGVGINSRAMKVTYEPFMPEASTSENRSEELDLKDDGSDQRKRDVVSPIDSNTLRLPLPFGFAEEDEDEEKQLQALNSMKDRLAMPPPRQTKTLSSRYRKFLNARANLGTTSALAKMVVQKNAPFKLMFMGKFNDLDLYHMLKNSFQNADSGSAIFMFSESIFENMFAESVNAVSVAKYLFILSHDAIKGSTLRSLFFKFLQKYYQERRSLCSRSEDSFKNFARFFAASVHHNRYPSIAPFESLLSGLLDIADMYSIYLNNYDDLKFFCIVLVRCALYLRMDPKLYTSIVIKKHSKIKNIARNKCKDMLKVHVKQTESLMWLMMVIDDINNSKALDFYASNLSHEELMPVLDEGYRILFPKHDLPLYKNIDLMKKYLTLINY